MRNAKFMPFLWNAYDYDSVNDYDYNLHCHFYIYDNHHFDNNNNNNENNSYVPPDEGAPFYHFHYKAHYQYYIIMNTINQHYNQNIDIAGITHGAFSV